MIIKEIPRVKPNTKSLIRYILLKAVRISGNIPINMRNIDEAASQIQKDFNSRLTSRQKSNEMHYVVSFEEKHEDISDDKLLLIGNELVKTHFNDNRNFLIAVHRDTNNPHLHLVMENRDFDKRPFFKKGNYRALEAFSQKLETKYRLKNQQISGSRSDPNVMRLNYKAKQYENRTAQTSDEKKYKEELKEILTTAITPVALFEMMKSQGFTICANKSKTNPAKLTGYYITKGAISIKPSSIGFQISKLTEKYKIDDDGIVKLILRFECVHLLDDAGKISTGPGLGTKPQTNRRESLYTKFQTLDGINYTSKDQKYNTRFTVANNSVSFINPNEISIKAGIQALVANGNNGPFCATGNDTFKRKTWLVCALMGQEISNYQPSNADLFALHERIRLNQKKYPHAKIKLPESHLTALKIESFEIDNLLNSSVSFSDLFPRHSEPETSVMEESKSFVMEQPGPPPKVKTKNIDSAKRRSKAERLFDDQETDEKLLKLSSGQKDSLLNRFNR